MLNWVSGIDEGPKRLRDLGIALPGIERNDHMHVALSLGHEIYTPTDISAIELLEDVNSAEGDFPVWRCRDALLQLPDGPAPSDQQCLSSPPADAE